MQRLSLIHIYLLLGSLIDLFPEDIHNYCFEADITNNELTFSYKLRDGVAQNMNCLLYTSGHSFELTFTHGSEIFTMGSGRRLFI